MKSKVLIFFFLINPILAPLNAGSNYLPLKKLKIGYLNNIAKFIEWDLPTSQSSIRFCVFRNSGLSSLAMKLLSERTIHNRPIEVVSLTGEENISSCQLIYFSYHSRTQIESYLKKVSRLPILTAGDSQGFASDLGIMRFYVETNKLRFEINIDSLKRSGLDLSSEVLSLSKIRRDEKVIDQ